MLPASVSAPASKSGSKSVSMAFDLYIDNCRNGLCMIELPEGDLVPPNSVFDAITVVAVPIENYVWASTVSEKLAHSVIVLVTRSSGIGYMIEYTNADKGKVKMSPGILAKKALNMVNMGRNYKPYSCMPLGFYSCEISHQRLIDFNLKFERLRGYDEVCHNCHIFHRSLVATSLSSESPMYYNFKPNNNYSSHFYDSHDWIDITGEIHTRRQIFELIQNGGLTCVTFKLHDRLSHIDTQSIEDICIEYDSEAHKIVTPQSMDVFSTDFRIITKSRKLAETAIKECDLKLLGKAIFELSKYEDVRQEKANDKFERVYTEFPLREVDMNRIFGSGVVIDAWREFEYQLEIMWWGMGRVRDNVKYFGEDVYDRFKEDVVVRRTVLDKTTVQELAKLKNIFEEITDLYNKLHGALRGSNINEASRVLTVLYEDKKWISPETEQLKKRVDNISCIRAELLQLCAEEEPNSTDIVSLLKSLQQENWFDDEVVSIRRKYMPTENARSMQQHIYVMECAMRSRDMSRLSELQDALEALINAGVRSPEMIPAAKAALSWSRRAVDLGRISTALDHLKKLQYDGYDNDLEVQASERLIGSSKTKADKESLVAQHVVDLNAAMKSRDMDSVKHYMQLIESIDRKAQDISRAKKWLQEEEDKARKDSQLDHRSCIIT